MKSVLITGAGSGIGREAAILFSQQGYRCLLLGRDLQKLTAVQKELEKASEVVAIDLTDSDFEIQITARLNELKITELHALINNAGVFSRGRLAECSHKEWQRMFETNVFGPARLTKSLLPYLKKGSGSIVNVSSTLGLRPTADTAIYSASKAAMNNWTQSLALDLAEFGIRTNAVCPGIVDTPIHEFHHLEVSKKQDSLRAMAGLQPLGRIGKPEDVARAIYFLATDASSWTTGALLNIDGGINL